MALPSAAYWNVRSDGNDTNGAGFVRGGAGTDYSAQASKNSGGNNGSTTDAVGNGTTTLTSATASFTSAVQDNLIYLQGGTGSLAAGWYRVTTFNSGTSITLDRSVGSGTGITMNIGGGLLTLGQAFTNVVNKNVIWLKNGTYSVTTEQQPASNSVGVGLIGYNSTYGDNGAPPTITTSTNSIILLGTGFNGAYSLFQNLKLTCTATTRGTGIRSEGGAGRMFIFNCSLDGFATGLDFSSNSPTVMISGCLTKNTTTNGLLVNGGSSVFVENSEFKGNTGTGTNSAIFVGGAGNTSFYMTRSIVSGASAAGINLDPTSPMQAIISNCTIANNAGSGITNTGGSNTGLFESLYVLQSNLVYGNGAWGANFDAAITPDAYFVRNNAWGNNTSGNYNHILAGSGDVSVSVDPFTASGSGDYSLNPTVGGGAACKGVGFPGTFPDGTTTGSSDIGAVESTGTGIGSGTSNYGFIG